MWHRLGRIANSFSFSGTLGWSHYVSYTMGHRYRHPRNTGARPRPGSARLRLAAAVAGVALLAGACGASDSSGEATASSSTTTSGADSTTGQSGATSEQASDSPESEAPPEATNGTADEASEAGDGPSEAGDGPSEAGDDPVNNNPAPDPALNQLADVEVFDIVSGEKVNIKSLATGEKPLLFWFWAPH